ncbi:MAG: recombinase zinc beta ribbon domain-containing protein [Anaerolineales bacterium]|nr:recombinase zinc beta ribbon domain-containing protein [Anaerolineales bacterium]
MLEDYCQPVVSKELWDLVQGRLEEHAKKQHVHSPRLHLQRKNSRYLLSGLLFCPRCGGAMSGFPSKNGYGKRYDRYGCGNAKRNKSCDMPALPRYGLEMAVINELVEHVLQKEVMTKLLHELETDAAGVQEAVTAEREEYTRRLTGVKKALDNISRAIEARGHSDTLLERLDVLEIDKANLQAKLEALQQQVQVALSEETEEGLDLTAQDLRLSLREGTDDERRDIIRGLVEKVVVDKWGKMMVGNIWFYFPPDNKNALIYENQGESVDIWRRSRRVST